MVRVMHASGVEQRAPDWSMVEQLVAVALELSIDDGPSVEARARLLCGMAGHDRKLIGRAWLSLIVQELHGNQSVVRAERLLAASLEFEGEEEPAGKGGAFEGEDEPAGEGGPSSLRVVS
ncbi:MAG TPA: hypothetical protein VEH29_12715 [Acidimicrobiales bacterium]|nr:hypothetical protein [Acidimicrobiales bacterium]